MRLLWEMGPDHAGHKDLGLYLKINVLSKGKIGSIKRHTQ